MKLARRHSWNLSPRDAIRLQARLAGSLKTGVREVCPIKIERIRLIAGADVSYSKKTNTCYAAVTVFRFPDMAIVEERTSARRAVFPYIPGLLSFRESAPLIAAFSHLKCEPDLLVFDAQGIAHPRRFGLASHVGYLYNKPSIGCAKSRLIGDFVQPGLRAGDWSYLRIGEEIVGCVLRSKTNCKPIYISPGHLMDVEWARRFIAQCLGLYRLPEITRRPHCLSNELRLRHESR